MQAYYENDIQGIAGTTGSIITIINNNYYNNNYYNNNNYYRCNDTMKHQYDTNITSHFLHFNSLEPLLLSISEKSEMENRRVGQ